MTCPTCAGTGRVTFPDGDGCACDGCDATGYQDEQHQRIATRLEGTYSWQKKATPTAPASAVTQQTMTLPSRTRR